MISASQITHLNFAFAMIDGSNRIAPSTSGDTALYKQAMTLKDMNPDLKIFISVGGWAFNDPGATQKRFSTMASSSSNRATFISSCLQFMKTYGFDGVDIDWAAIDSSGNAYGLTITTPSSYYYLRQFDVAELAKWIDWFNHMTYDLHGVWDKDSKFLGPYVNSHSNLTEIDISMDLFWRNKIPPSKISMGLGFYGRSFQLASSSCTKPGCTFTGPANAGACTGAAGILSYSEIQSAINSTSAQRKRATANVVWDKTAAVKYAYWGNQWVSYDDTDTFKQKIDYANKLGLGGMLIWAIDQELAVRADGQKALQTAKSMRDNCHATECSEDPRCPTNFSPIAVRSSPDKITAPCKKGTKQLICCSSNNMPQSCRWAGGAPNCRTDGQCSTGEEELARDSHGDGAKCLQGSKALCCVPPKQEADALKQCKWFGTAPSCGNDAFCNDPAYPVQVTTGKGQGGNGEYCFSGHKVLCCPASNTYLNCAWTGTSSCFTSSCSSGQVVIASDSEGDKGFCWIGNHRNYCCDAPTSPAPDKPPTQNGHWGSPKDEGCKSNGYRQWSSKLLDVSGRAKITLHGLKTLISCVFGIWGKFWVPDDKCCSSSKNRALTPADFGINERDLVPRTPPATCGGSGSGGVNPNPINPANGVLALSVFQLMANGAIRRLLQAIWNFSFSGGTPNQAREQGLFIFQHRTQPQNVIVYIGLLDRGGTLADQRFPETPTAYIMDGPGIINGDRRAFPPRDDQVVGQLTDYTLIAVAHTHPFLLNMGYGLRYEPSEPDHIAAWRYGIPMLVVTRAGTYLAGPTRRITRNGPNDLVITNLLNAGNPRFEIQYWIMPQNQIPRYDENQYQPFAGTAEFVPQPAPGQLNEPTNGVPLIPPGMVIVRPNPNAGNENSAPGPNPNSAP
ncbi:hypothetical protein FRC09_005227 [Ceratobasidium sp. 395]|nr:hypothetical protein FRC09_005227 [Ceratobasidium sp. 395]